VKAKNRKNPHTTFSVNYFCLT